MFHKVLMTNLTPLSSINEIHCLENRPFTKIWPHTQERQKQKGPVVTRTIKKKRRNRTSFTTEQLKYLENTYTNTKYVDKERRHRLANVLGIADKCIKVWFQNRRMKEKKESSDCSNTSCESFVDSTSPLPQTEMDFKKQIANIHQNYNTENTITYFHQLPYSEHNNVTQNQFADEFNNTISVPSSFYNETNIYPTQYYPYAQNECSYNLEPYNQCYERNSEPQSWSSETFNLSFFNCNN